MSLYLLSQSLINKHVYLTFAVIQPTNIYDFKCDIPELRGDNYKVSLQKRRFLVTTISSRTKYVFLLRSS